MVIDGNRARRRLISLARWAFPDVWGGFAGSMPTAVAVLTRWPHLSSLATARRSSLTAVVAAHTRAVPDVPARVEPIRVAAAAWAEFWDGHLDLDALAWEVTEHLTDMATTAQRIARATEQAQHCWAKLYGDDPLLLSLPGMGPMTAPTVRAFLGAATAGRLGQRRRLLRRHGALDVVVRHRAVTQPTKAAHPRPPLPTAVAPRRCQGAAPAGGHHRWPSRTIGLDLHERRRTLSRAEGTQRPLPRRFALPTRATHQALTNVRESLRT